MAIRAAAKHTGDPLSVRCWHILDIPGVESGRAHRFTSLSSVGSQASGLASLLPSSWSSSCSSWCMSANFKLSGPTGNLPKAWALIREHIKMHVVGVLGCPEDEFDAHATEGQVLDARAVDLFASEQLAVQGSPASARRTNGDATSVLTRSCD